MTRPWAQSLYTVNRTRMGSKGFIIHQITRSTESSISKFIKLASGTAKRHGATTFETAKKQREVKALRGDRKKVPLAG